MFATIVCVCRCSRISSKQFYRSFAEHLSSTVSDVDMPDQISNTENVMTREASVATKNVSDLEVESLISGLDSCVVSEESPQAALHPPNEGTDLRHFAPYFKPTFNFAAYINKSPSLQQLVNLGVDLYKLERRKGVAEYVLTLDFERDMKDHIRFLHEKGVSADILGWFLTRNPQIFKENLEDLQVRINYLESKRFTADMVSTVISKNPLWLSFSTKEIDSRLGHFQKTFSLTGNEVRFLATKQPRLITYDMHQIKVNTFVVKEELGFEAEEMKMLLLKQPKLWMIHQHALLERFEFVHNEMKISHQQIIEFSRILNSRVFRIKQRHLFLQYLGRAQYDPTLENYVPLGSLVDGTDAEFCQNVAKTSIEAFNVFLKTL